MNYADILAGVIEVLGAMNTDTELAAKIAKLDAATTEARAEYEAAKAKIDEREPVEKTRTKDEVRGALS